MTMPATSSPLRGVGAQTLALLIDAYRDLQARKLFWITLFLSLVVAVAFGFVGINERGITIFGAEYPGVWNTSIIPPDAFYKFLFTALAIPYWLGFAAAVLGLISVGGIFPDLIGGGSIDLYLCRPVARIRLFLTKYLFGLLFSALQILLFSAASFVIIGVRGGSWEPRIFLAVPLVTLFFSYLYCVCVLIGIVTRSALAAILLTMLFWVGLWAVHTSDMAVTTFAAAADERVAIQERAVEANQKILDQNAQLPPDKRADLKAFEFQDKAARDVLAGYQDTANKLRWWQRLIISLKTPLPKTSETVDLMSRWVLDPEPFMQAQEESTNRRNERVARHRGTTRRTDELPQVVGSRQVQERIANEMNARKFGWIVGTSVAFECVVLGLAGWIFCRRDY